jgi:hypothetical protein
MSVTLGNGTITSLNVGGLPAGSVTSADLANNSILANKLAFTGTWLQVVSTTKTDTYSNNSGGWAAITGLSLSITPSSTSSKILLIFSISYDSNRTNSGGGFAWYRNGSVIGGNIGAAAGTFRYRVYTDFGANPNNDQSGMQRSGWYLDSPSTTSAITYQVYKFQDSSNFTTVVNRATADANDNDDGRFASSVTAIEISG